MCNYDDDRFSWQCTICDTRFPHEPGIALHILEKHDTNILLLDENVDLTPLRIILPTRSKFYARVESSSEVPINVIKIEEVDEISDHDEEEEIVDQESDSDSEDDSDNSPPSPPSDTDLPSHQHQPCYICGEKFATKKDLISHRKTHNGQRPYSCDTCPETFSSWVTCEMHKLRHTPEWPELEKDAKKLSEQKRKFALRRKNWRNKFYKAPKIYPCPHCEKTFTWPTRLRNHIRAHSTEKPFVCRTCSSAYKNLYQLRNHTASGNCSKVILATFSRGFQCDLCPVRVKTERTLKSHRKVMHGIYSPRPAKPSYSCSCSQCSHVSATPGEFKDHANMHAGVKPYPCEALCGLAFTKRSNMLAHIRGRCAKARELGLDLKFLAEQKARAEKKNGRCAVIPDGVDCPVCGKKFSNFRSMMTHQEIHGTGKWACEICGVGFQHKATVERHRREFHPEVLPVECPDCGKRYRTEYVMRKHRRLVHRVKDEENKKLATITTIGDEGKKRGILREPVVCEEVEILVESCNGDVKDVDPLQF